MYLLFFLGFALGAACGCWLFWQGLKQHDELYEEYIALLKEMEREKLFRGSKN